MDSTIQLLREKAAHTGSTETWDVFELLTTQCSCCCVEWQGGNGSCCPCPKKIAE